MPGRNAETNFPAISRVTWAQFTYKRLS